MNQKQRSLANSRSEAQKIYYQRKEIKRLQQGIEELKTKLDIFILSNKAKQETIDNFRERIEKAVEYIEHNTFQDSDDSWIFTFYKGKEMLLDILNGRSDE